jgi:hypothetical protein
MAAVFLATEWHVDPGGLTTCSLGNQPVNDD